MQYRALGRSGLQVSPICFGGNVFGWTADENTSFSLLDAWLDEGFNFIDTADVYSRWVKGHTGGESETILGKWLKASGKRDKIVLATKVGKPMPGGQGLSPAYIRSAVEESLRRLQTDAIDLYQSHDDDAETSQEETMGAFAELVREGKVRALGCSNYTPERLRSALQVSERLGLPRYESLQPLYNLYSRQDFEGGLQQVCTEYGVGVITFYALASGFLTGKYRTAEDAAKSLRGGNIVKNYLNERGLRILDALDAVAKKNNATCAQVAVAWQLAKPAVTAPIASATSVQQLHELAAAARLKLTSEDVSTLDDASR
jgi:aryl-alcohol dehydrogenase-like predicted oxidoreductase